MPSELEFYESLQWRRASEIYPQLKMEEDKIFNVYDMSQGEAGHAYILAYLASLAEYKERVQKVIITKQVNSACIYRVKFFVNGLRTSIIVDDHVPVLPDNHKPAFCSSKK